MQRLWCVLAIVAATAATATAQTIRNYDVNFATTAPTIDGIVSPGEWDAAAAEAGDWRELRNAFTDVDEDNNRFRILYDNTNLYILYETDYDFGWLTPLPGGGTPAIIFGEENLNIYIDPNNDGDLNLKRDLSAVDPGVEDGSSVDSYQFAFNQYEGTYNSTDGDRQDIGFFTEAHVNSPFGDQAGWNNGGDATLGAGLNGSSIAVAQVNTNAGGGSGVAEIVIPFADLDADAVIGGPNTDFNGDGVQDAADYTLWRDTEGDVVGNEGDGMLDGADSSDNGTVDANDYGDWFRGYGLNAEETATGLNATAGVEAGDVWGFNMSMITRDSANNFLPIWNWKTGGSFAPAPLGTLTFQAEPASSAAGVPEPTALAIAVLAGLGLAARRR